MTSHLDADVLADYREGLLSGRRSARIREHLDGCAQCSSLAAGLAEVTELLASTPTPPMPEHLVARLENALAVEAAARSGTAATEGETTGSANGAAAKTTGTDVRPHRIWRPHPGRPGWGRGAVLGAAAVIVIILAIGVYGLAKVMHQNTSTTASGNNVAAPGSPHPGASVAPRQAQGALAPPRYAASLPAGSLHVIASGTDYQPGTLAGQVESLLNRQRTNPANLAPPIAGPGRASSPRLRACVTLVTGDRLPRLVDLASYQGRPATVIVQAVTAGKPAQVWVVGSGCSPGQRDVIAHTEITSKD